MSQQEEHQGNKHTFLTPLLPPKASEYVFLAKPRWKSECKGGIDVVPGGQPHGVEEGAEWIWQSQQKAPSAPLFLSFTITESKGAQISGNYRFFSLLGDNVYCVTLIQAPCSDARERKIMIPGNYTLSNVLVSSRAEI